MSERERERERGRAADAERTIAADDVDDVVGVAAALEQADQQRVGVGEMKEIAAELRIDPRYVEPAIDSLERGRRMAREARERARKRRIALAIRGAIGLGGIAAALALGAAWTRGVLAPAWSDVERARAQVETVRERRERVEEIWRDRPASLDRDAELAGAENRVGIERRRYDEAAAAYNARAGGLPHVLFCRVAGVPCRAELSSEIEGW